MRKVSILFAREDSVYKSLDGCDVWDAARDAMNWPGGTAVVAHPPCRAWGRLRTFARPQEGEKELAIWAVKQVQKWGGVLEHPAQSTLWGAVNLSRPSLGMEQDRFGGWTLPILQYWFGHEADKPTWLYIVGVKESELPPFEIRLGYAPKVIQSRKRMNHLPHVRKADREHTPLQLAQWLCEVARLSRASARPLEAA